MLLVKYMTSISKNVHIHKLADLVNKHNNTSSIIKMKAIDVKSNAYWLWYKNNDKDPRSWWPY